MWVWDWFEVGGVIGFDTFWLILVCGWGWCGDGVGMVCRSSHPHCPIRPYPLALFSGGLVWWQACFVIIDFDPYHSVHTYLPYSTHTQHTQINNAGVMAVTNLERTKEGFERHIGVNHLGA